VKSRGHADMMVLDTWAEGDGPQWNSNYTCLGREMGVLKAALSAIKHSRYAETSPSQPIHNFATRSTAVQDKKQRRWEQQGACVCGSNVGYS
jgi:hypothetical protein